MKRAKTLWKAIKTFYIHTKFHLKKTHLVDSYDQLKFLLAILKSADPPFTKNDVLNSYKLQMVCTICSQKANKILHTSFKFQLQKQNILLSMLGQSQCNLQLSKTVDRILTSPFSSHNFLIKTPNQDS